MSVLDRARAAEDPQAVIPALTTAAMLELERGNTSTAVALIRERVALIGKREGSYAVAHTEAARVLVAVGELDLLEELRRQDDFPIRRTRLSQATSGALLAEATGRTDEALAMFTAAAEGWAAYPHPLETALAEMGAARALLRLARPTEADARTSSARRVFADLGAVRQTKDADDLIALAGARSA